MSSVEGEQAKELAKVARWFADEMVGNEMKAVGLVLPPFFSRLVADRMVSNPKLGWPDAEQALAALAEDYGEAS